MVLVMSRSIAQGAAAGVATAAGVSVGLVGHTILATAGLGAILRTSEWLFVVLKLAGAAYLIYLGIGQLRTRRTELDVRASSKRSLARLFLDGAVSNVSNPKIAIFYFAFLPQFVPPSAADATLAVFVLGYSLLPSRSSSKAPSVSSRAGCQGASAHSRAFSFGCIDRVVQFWSGSASGWCSSAGRGVRR